MAGAYLFISHYGSLNPTLVASKQDLLIHIVVLIHFAQDLLCLHTLDSIAQSPTNRHSGPNMPQILMSRFLAYGLNFHFQCTFTKGIHSVIPD